MKRTPGGGLFLALALLAAACASGGNASGPADASTAPSEGGAFEAAGPAREASVDAAVDDASAPSQADSGAGDQETGVTGDAGSTPDTGAPPGDASSGAETSAGGDGGGCTGGEILCGSGCVDPTTDSNNCGGCGNWCATGICGSSLAADMAQQPASWSFNGVAVWDQAGPSARLTQANTDLVAGSVIYQHPVATDTFQASFRFRIGMNGGGQWDGMGFMIQTNGPTALGSNGGGLGMSGLDGFGVELDVYDNNQCGDSNANHVGVDQLSGCGSGLLTSLFASADLTGTVTLSDAQWHSATVQLAGGALSVTLDGNAVASGVALPGFTAGTRYYYGFAGAIGGGSGSGGMQTEVRDVSITFPTPRCL